ncbi:hypothetical protein DFH07DRAFT_936101 [Mycena maculata]|uniref:Uncharacterized protein n=1 Tax=Mycena maculata TaxID=230809 RepID=A0AAD7KCF5_9AGAR|nr:hypothetical protein DFH07DRAFT_936101 [Mycena maculata]
MTVALNLASDSCLSAVSPSPAKYILIPSPLRLCARPNHLRARSSSSPSPDAQWYCDGHHPTSSPTQSRHRPLRVTGDCAHGGNVKVVHGAVAHDVLGVTRPVARLSEDGGRTRRVYEKGRIMPCTRLAPPHVVLCGRRAGKMGNASSSWQGTRNRMNAHEGKSAARAKGCPSIDLRACRSAESKYSGDGDWDGDTAVECAECACFRAFNPGRGRANIVIGTREASGTRCSVARVAEDAYIRCRRTRTSDTLLAAARPSLPSLHSIPSLTPSSLSSLHPPIHLHRVRLHLRSETDQHADKGGCVVAHWLSAERNVSVYDMRGRNSAILPTSYESSEAVRTVFCLLLYTTVEVLLTLMMARLVVESTYASFKELATSAVTKVASPFMRLSSKGNLDYMSSESR